MINNYIFILFDKLNSGGLKTIRRYKYKICELRVIIYMKNINSLYIPINIVAQTSIKNVKTKLKKF